MRVRSRPRTWWQDSRPASPPFVRSSKRCVCHGVGWFQPPGLCGTPRLYLAPRPPPCTTWPMHCVHVYSRWHVSFRWGTGYHPCGPRRLPPCHLSCHAPSAVAHCTLHTVQRDRTAPTTLTLLVCDPFPVSSQDEIAKLTAENAKLQSDVDAAKVQLRTIKSKAGQSESTVCLLRSARVVITVGSHVLIHTRTRTHTHTHTRARAHTHAHARSHIPMHTRPFNLPPSISLSLIGNGAC
jgi:hypothetical protein